MFNYYLIEVSILTQPWEYKVVWDHLTWGMVHREEEEIRSPHLYQ